MSTSTNNETIRLNSFIKHFWNSMQRNDGSPVAICKFKIYNLSNLINWQSGRNKNIFLRYVKAKVTEVIGKFETRKELLHKKFEFWGGRVDHNSQPHSRLLESAHNKNYDSFEHLISLIGWRVVSQGDYKGWNMKLSVYYSAHNVSYRMCVTNEWVQTQRIIL